MFYFLKRLVYEKFLLRLNRTLALAIIRAGLRMLNQEEDVNEFQAFIAREIQREIRTKQPPLRPLVVAAVGPSLPVPSPEQIHGDHQVGVPGQSYTSGSDQKDSPRSRNDTAPMISLASTILGNNITVRSGHGDDYPASQSFNAGTKHSQSFSTGSTGTSSMPPQMPRDRQEPGSSSPSHQLASQVSSKAAESSKSLGEGNNGQLFENGPPHDYSKEEETGDDSRSFHGDDYGSYQSVEMSYQDPEPSMTVPVAVTSPVKILVSKQFTTPTRVKRTLVDRKDNEHASESGAVKKTNKKKKRRVIIDSDSDDGSRSLKQLTRPVPQSSSDNPTSAVDSNPRSGNSQRPSRAATRDIDYMEEVLDDKFVEAILDSNPGLTREQLAKDFNRGFKISN